MQDEKEMVREEENETPEAPDQEEALKQSEADTETEQEEAAEADKKPRKEKKLFKKDRTAELEAKIAELEQALADQKNAKIQGVCGHGEPEEASACGGRNDQEIPHPESWRRAADPGFHGAGAGGAQRG